MLKLQEKLAPSAIVKRNFSAEEFAIHDQIVMGTDNKVICENPMLKNLDLQELHNKSASCRRREDIRWSVKQNKPIFVS